MSSPQRRKFRDLPSDGEIREAIMYRLAGKARVHVKPDIPGKVSKGAIRSFAQVVDKDDVLFIVDDSRHGDAEYGLLATKDMAFVREWVKNLPVSRLLGPGPLNFTVTAKTILLDKKHFGSFVRVKEPTVAAVAGALGYLSGMYVPETSRTGHLAPKNQTSGTIARELSGQRFLAFSPPPSEKEILTKLRTILDGAANTFVSPKIPPMKLKSAMESYAKGVREIDVLFQIDDTVFGGAGDGLMATREKVYSKGFLSDPVSARLGPPPAYIQAFGKRIMVDGKPLADLTMSAETAAKVVAALQYLSGLTGPRLPQPDLAPSTAPGSMPGNQPSSQSAGPEMSEILSVLSSKLENLSSVFLKPSIPSEKLSTAIKSYAPNVQESDVLMLADTTLFGSAGDGMLATLDMVYAKDLWAPTVSAPLGPPIPSFTIDGNKIRINGVHIVDFAGMTQTAAAAVVNALRYLAGLRGALQPPASSSLTAAHAPDTGPLLTSRPAPMPPKRPDSETSLGKAEPAAPPYRPLGQAKPAAPPCRPPHQTEPAASPCQPFGQTVPAISPALAESAMPPVNSEPAVPPSVPFGSLASRIPEIHAQAAAPFAETAVRLGAMLHGVGNVSAWPDLDMGKLGAALVGFASAARAADVIFQVHDSASPGGSAVMVVTGDAVYARPAGGVGGTVTLSPENPPVMVSGEYLVMGGTPFARLEGMSDRERQAVALSVSFVAMTSSPAAPSPGTAATAEASRPRPLSDQAGPVGTSPESYAPSASAQASRGQSQDSPPDHGTTAGGTPPASRPFWEDIPSSIPVSPARNVAESGPVSLEKDTLTDADRARDATLLADRSGKKD
ncbi:MAG: hypothetical protein LBT40_11235 [Deltaproteobacteria bacterium]|nr:hypothetical protein [Deltaproteobacteria bacterium]